MTTSFMFEAEPFDVYPLFPSFEEIPLFDQPGDVDLFLSGLALPSSPYAADALSFARRVAAGENMQTAALSLAGRRVFRRMQR
jgi:hypothetical protein